MWNNHDSPSPACGSGSRLKPESAVPKNMINFGWNWGNPFRPKKDIKGQLWMSQTIPCSCVVRWHRLFFVQYRSDPLHGVWPARSLWNIIVYINIHTICTHASYRPGWCFHHQTSLKSLGVINLLVCIGGAKSKIAHQFSARFQFGVWVCLKMGYRY